MMLGKLQKEWHPTKNVIALTEAKTISKVWWLCSEGHEWQSKVRLRLKGASCPACALQLKSLAALNPDITKEWHPTKNGKLKPNMVLANSHKFVWWQCLKHGHEWCAPVNNRQKGSGCPFEAGKRVWAGNSFSKRFPLVAKEWHPTKNGGLKPEDVTYGSGSKVWWVCAGGHEWQETVHHRSQGRACPTCSGKKGGST